MILKNKTAKILDLDHPLKLHPWKICKHMIFVPSCLARQKPNQFISSEFLGIYSNFNIFINHKVIIRIGFLVSRG